MPRDVVIAGGHGQVAMRLERLLAAGGVRVRGLIRNAEQAGDLEAIGAEPVVLDLEAAGDDDVAAAIAGADAIVFAAGSGPGSGEGRKRTMDRDGAVKLVRAAQAGGPRRFVMVSSMGADPDAEPEGFGAYLRAKGEADEAVRASGLDFTILRPGRLTDDPGTGRVRLGEGLGSGSVSRDDVATTIAALLATGAGSGRTADLLAGPTPIDDAVAAL
jgi:uncharacterized protein YbjT (DUF2867 family)